ncbi:MAG TPA: sigma-54 dependent transcriptional regulator [Terriglobales bacterium]|nr:sigma-54 dependent transcriptional regulator [Terriglobales bacterium]
MNRSAAKSPLIFVVDDEPTMLRYLRTLLEVEGYRVESATNGAEAMERLRQPPVPDLLLLDVLMPVLDGLQTLEQVRALHPQLKVVMLSCVSDTRKVVQAIRLGAQDYLTKPFQKADLEALIEQCLGNSREHAHPVQGDIEDLGDDVFFVAASPAMKKIRSQSKLVANVDIPVLMLGESGTGKEVVSRLIHKYSPRAHRTFLKVNCAAVPADLLESELFGYEPGAFTGATHSKPGKFELCNKGTILLDEIGEMPPQLQAKLLHVLQDQQFSRLGSRNVIKVDVRILAATNIDIPRAIAEKKLREDLYYRLNGFTIQLPPLRERREEIGILLRHMISQIGESYGKPSVTISPRLLEACERYNWPGNLRELGNFVKRFLILGDEDMAIQELQVGMGAPSSSPSQAAAAPNDRGLKGLVRNVKDEAEIEAITKALEQTGWNRKKAAGILQISYKALLYKIRQYDIQRSGTTVN